MGQSMPRESAAEDMIAATIIAGVEESAPKSNLKPAEVPDSLLVRATVPFTVGDARELVDDGSQSHPIVTIGAASNPRSDVSARFLGPSSDATHGVSPIGDPADDKTEIVPSNEVSAPAALVVESLNSQQSAQPPASLNDNFRQLSADSDDAQPMADAEVHAADKSFDFVVSGGVGVGNDNCAAQPVLKKKTSLSFAEAIFSGNVDGLTRQPRETATNETSHQDEQAPNAASSTSEDTAPNKTALVVCDETLCSVLAAAVPRTTPDSDVRIPANGVGADNTSMRGSPNTRLPVEPPEDGDADTPADLGDFGLAQQAAEVLPDKESEASAGINSHYRDDQRVAMNPEARSEAIISEASFELSAHSGLSYSPAPEADGAVPRGESLGSIGATEKKDGGVVGVKRVEFASPVGMVALLEQTSTPSVSASVGVEESLKSREPVPLSRGSLGHSVSSSLSPPLLSARPASMSGTSFQHAGHCIVLADVHPLRADTPSNTVPRMTMTPTDSEVNAYRECALWPVSTT